MQTSPALAPGGPMAPTAQDLDLELIQLTLGGDRSAFERIYTKYVRKIYSLVFRVIGTSQEAEEVTQEVFCQVYRGLAAFGGRSQLYTWIYRIATNIALQHVRKLQRQRAAWPRVAPEVVAEIARAYAGHGNPERTAESREFYFALERAVSALPANQRVVMVLGPIQGHSYAQMAEILGTNPDVIKARLHRARENIRGCLKSVRRLDS